MFEPRIKSSLNHKPQNVPPELLKMVSEAFREKYDLFLKTRELSTEGSVYPEEIILLIGFRNKGSIRQFNFECSLNYDVESLDEPILEKIHKAIDALDSMMSEYVQNFKELDPEADTVDDENEVVFPRDWTPFDFEKTKIFLKSSTTNTDIERLTEAFLKENDICLEPALEDSQERENTNLPLQ